jgi:hypothetical protein
MNKIYINNFHKKQTEDGLIQVEYWKKHPMSLNDIQQQQLRLNKQRAIRESN